MAVIIRRLEETDGTGNFDCGDQPLDNYLHKYAWVNHPLEIKNRRVPSE
jgi:hypothetical protein